MTNSRGLLLCSIHLLQRIRTTGYQLLVMTVNQTPSDELEHLTQALLVPSTATPAYSQCKPQRGSSNAIDLGVRIQL